MSYIGLLRYHFDIIKKSLNELEVTWLQFAVIKKMADVDFTTMLCEPELVMITARTVLFAYINLGINNIYLQISWS